MKATFFRRFIGAPKVRAASVPPAHRDARETPSQQTAVAATPPADVTPADVTLVQPSAPKTATDHLHTGIGTAVSFAKNALKSSISLLVIVVFAVSLWALLLRVVSPKPLIVVDSFEVSSEIEKQAGFSGKNAANVFTDELNAAASAGERFKGNDYTSPHHYGRIRNVFRIPVQTTYGIQFSGISVDVLMDIYRRFRYDEWRISGDMVKAGPDAAGKDPERVDVRVRVRRKSSSENWEVTGVPAAGVNAAVQSLARAMLSREQPELMGRANLQWALTSSHSPEAAEHYAQALENFRSWAINEPQNPLPYYYMSIAYHYWPDHGQESSDLALWSQETLKDSGRWQKSAFRSAWDWVRSYSHGPSHSSDTEQYAIGTQAAAELLMAKWPPVTLAIADPLDDFARQRKAALDHFDSAEAMLDRLVAAGSPDADTEENLATVKSRRADLLAGQVITAHGIEKASLSDLEAAYKDDTAATAMMSRIIAEEPDSAGFHSNLGTEYLHTGMLALDLATAGKPPQPSDGPAHWFRAGATQAEDSLHLYPQLTAALLVAAESLTGLERASPSDASSAHNERAHVCRTLQLVVPGSAGSVKDCQEFLPSSPAAGPLDNWIPQSATPPARQSTSARRSTAQP